VRQVSRYLAHLLTQTIDMRKVVIAGPPPAQVLDVTGPLEVFSNGPDYKIQLANPGIERTLQTNRILVSFPSVLLFLVD
jgi:hypothetical protein